MADNAAIPLYQKYYKRYAARVKVRQIKETDLKVKYQAMTKRDECSDGKITLSEFEEWLESSFQTEKRKIETRGQLTAEESALADLFFIFRPLYIPDTERKTSKKRSRQT